MSLQQLEVDEAMRRLFVRLSKLESQPIESGHVSEALARLGAVPPFLRALLVADGTVTMALEAYFQEAIVINTLRQGHLPIPASISVLGMNKGDDCLFREVELKGEKSGTLYAHACSLINKNAISSGLFEHLVDEHEGIGVVLRNVAKGSFREVLNLSKGGVMINSDLNRTYRVSLNAIPAILITEEFPLAVYL